MIFAELLSCLPKDSQKKLLLQMLHIQNLTEQFEATDWNITYVDTGFIVYRESEVDITTDGITGTFYKNL